jgi:hypothetical protein
MIAIMLLGDELLDVVTSRELDDEECQPGTLCFDVPGYAHWYFVLPVTRTGFGVSFDDPRWVTTKEGRHYLKTREVNNVTLSVFEEWGL